MKTGDITIDIKDQISRMAVMASRLVATKDPSTLARDFSLAVNAGYVRDLLVMATETGLLDKAKLASARVLWPEGESEPKAQRVVSALNFANKNIAKGYTDAVLDIGAQAGEIMKEAEAHDHQFGDRVRIDKLVDQAETLGLVRRSGMENTGLMKGQGLAGVVHVWKRAVRALHILDNPEGYTPPSKPLYGFNDGIRSPKP